MQWSLSDSISNIFSHVPIGHKEQRIQFCFSPEKGQCHFKTMNFDANEAMKEYFVDHLKMKLLYSIIIQNKHVQKLIQAAPGIAELFFLGRLFWLVELAQKERGVFYHRIIVDTPATGHGVSLFGITKAVANLGMTGPLALECERVTKLLSNEQKTAAFLVTLPEELPSEECMESIPIIKQKLGYNPLFLIVNQSVLPSLYPNLENYLQESWFKNLLHSFHSESAKNSLTSLMASIMKRNVYEKKLEQFAQLEKMKLLSIPDFNLTQKESSALQIIKAMTGYFHEIS